MGLKYIVREVVSTILMENYIKWDMKTVKPKSGFKGTPNKPAVRISNVLPSLVTLEKEKGQVTVVNEACLLD